MADKPIILKPHEVHGFLAGRQTQIRRVVKPQPYLGRYGSGAVIRDDYFVWEPRPGEVIPLVPDCAYRWMPRAPFAVGDRLVGKETWARTSVAPIVETIDRPWIVYREADNRTDYGGPWRSPATMPRWASRITLTVKEVRCQRVQEISEADAIAEGVTSDSDGWRDYLMPCTQCCASARDSFSTLWKSIHGPDAWDRNDWVFAYTVEPALANIDKLEAA